MNESEIQARSQELLELKKLIKELLVKEKQLKDELLPVIKEQGPFNSNVGRVYYAASKGAETFSRKNVLQYLRDGYGDALADQVDEDCTKQGEPRETLYVKLNDL
jgi:hypothetical protein